MADESEILKLLREVYQGIYGVKNTEDKGMAGDVKNMACQLAELNRSVIRNTQSCAENKEDVYELRKELKEHIEHSPKSVDLPTPLDRKWFWILVAIVILVLAGVPFADVVGTFWS